MRVWVVNASPLILLGKIGALSLLPKLGGQVVIPCEVAAEIEAGPSDDAARLWLGGEGRTFVVGPVRFDPRVLAWDLGAGETAVISLAVGTREAVCLLDDRAARDCAQVFGARVKGTIGIVVLAKKAGLIPEVRPVIDALVSAGALLSDAVIRDALELAGEAAKR